MQRLCQNAHYAPGAASLCGRPGGYGYDCARPGSARARLRTPRTTTLCPGQSPGCIAGTPTHYFGLACVSQPRGAYAMSTLRPAAVCRHLLATLDASEGRRKRRKRNTTPDAIGLTMRRHLLEGTIQDDPDPLAFE